MKRKNAQGFTLIEIILVMVIISMIIFAGINYIQMRSEQMRVDRTSLQIQAILNAAMSYYVAHGQWPTSSPGNPNSIATLMADGYLPPTTTPGTILNPWGQGYVTKVTTSNFIVWTRVPGTGTSSAAASANAIMTTLPLSYTTPTAGNPPIPGTACTSTGACWVVAQVNIPGQNLNNARAVNFAGLYHHGACVPAPQCPVDVTGATMVPQIMVVPVSVSGVNDANSSNVYPISSFTAYATGGQNGTPVASPPACNASGDAPSCTINNTGPTVSEYWRVCLNVITEKGDVSTTNVATGSGSFPYEPWGGDVTLLAITRCAVNGEATGSNFNVYSQ